MSPPQGTGTDVSLCLETVGGMSMEHRLVQAVFGLELVCRMALNVSAELCSTRVGSRCSASVRRMSKTVV